MTSFNVAPYVRRAVESVLAQTYPNWELVVLDGGSSDDTRKILSTYQDPRIRLLFPEQRVRYVAGKNELLRAFKGELACFLDADDWMREDRVALQARVFEQHPDAAACVCNYVRVYPGGKEVPAPFLGESRFIDVRRDGVGFAGAAMMFRRTTVEKIGAFEPYFEGLMGDDHYWTLRIAQQLRCYHLNEDLYFYRANPTSIGATLDHPRKLTVTAALDKLKQQRLETGTDWLEQGRHADLLAFEEALMKDDVWMGERLRLHAAVRLDHGDVKGAATLLRKALERDPRNPSVAKTALYLVRTAARRLLARKPL